MKRKIDHSDKQLEDFRYNDHAMQVLGFATTPPLKIWITHNEQAIRAYRYTMICLADLERSTTFINNGLNRVEAFLMWYGAIDSFINSLLKVVAIKINSDERTFIVLPLDKRYDLILKCYQIPTENRTDQSLIEKLEDLNVLHNYFNTPFFEHETLTHKKANLTNNPAFLNQVDICQTFLIAFESFQRLRHIIPGLDLMPNISLITPDNRVVYDKLDVMKAKLVIPTIKDILKKHHLKMNLNLDEVIEPYIASPLFAQGQIFPAFKIEEDERFKISLSALETSINNTYYRSYVKKFDDTTKKFNQNYFLDGYHPFLKSQ